MNSNALVKSKCHNTVEKCYFIFICCHVKKVKFHMKSQSKFYHSAEKCHFIFICNHVKKEKFHVKSKALV